MADIDRIKEAQERVSQETGRMKERLDKQHQALKEVVEAQQEQVDSNIGNAVERIEADTQRGKDYALKIGRPINGLYMKLSVWGKLPDIIRSQISEEVSGLIQQARERDPISQQILGGVKDRLLREKINVQSLPSLDWEIKNQPPKP